MAKKKVKTPAQKRLEMRNESDTEWKWEVVADKMSEYIAMGGTRAKFAGQDFTPSISLIYQNIGLNDELNSRVTGAYRFRSEARIDDLMEARKEMLDPETTMTPAEFNNLQHGLLRELQLMTNMATTPNKAEPIKVAKNADGLAGLLDSAASRIEAEDNADKAEGEDEA